MSYAQMDRPMRCGGADLDSQEAGGDWLRGTDTVAVWGWLVVVVALLVSEGRSYA